MADTATPRQVTAPLRTAMLDPQTGLVTPPWALFFQAVAKQLNDANTAKMVATT